MFPTPTTTSECLLSAAAALIVVFVTANYFRNRRYYRLGRRLPGPKPWPILGNIPDFFGLDMSDKEQVAKAFTNSRQLQAVWLGPYLLVSLSSPAEAQVFCTSRDLTHRGREMDLMKPLFGKGLAVINGPALKKAREIIIPKFQTTFLNSHVFVKYGRILMQKLKAEVGKPAFDVYGYVRNCTFDIIYELTLGNEIHFQDRGVKELDNFTKISTLLFARVFKVWQYPDFLYQFSRDGKEVSAHVKRFKSLVENPIRSATKNDKKQQDQTTGSSNPGNFLLDMLKDGRWSSEELKDQAFNIVIAGYEKTANTISFLLVMLALHPEVQEKAHKEVREIYDSLGNKDLNMNEVDKLSYLDMIIKETMRLFPPVPSTTRKMFSDLQIEDHLVPKGASLVLDMYNVHRNSDTWQNSDKFDPDNFLPERVAQRHPYAFVPFGDGARACVGAKYAMLSMKVILVLVLSKFRFDCDYKMEDIKFKLGINLSMADGWNVRITERK